MKRFVSIFAAIVLAFAMAAPAAAIVYRPEWKSTVDSALSAIERSHARSTVPAGYTYKLVQYYVYNGNAIVFVYYSSSPLISNGMTVYRVSNAYASSPTRNADSAVISLNISTDVNGMQTYVGLVSGSPGGQIINERSTARIQGLDENSHAVANIETPVVDKTRLLALISEAEQKQAALYDAGSWTILQEALAAARALVAGRPTQAEVDAMCDRLQAALDGLQLIPTLPDTSLLRATLVEAKAIDDIGYTPPTWNRLRVSIHEGDALLARSFYTAPEVSTATVNLRTSIDGLVLYEAPPATPHRYLVDGIRVEDLLPAQDAIMANFEEARKFGIYVFVIILVFYIVPRLVRPDYLPESFGGGNGSAVTSSDKVSSGNRVGKSNKVSSGNRTGKSK